MGIDYTKRPSGGSAQPVPPASPVSLTKRGEKVVLTKGGDGTGPVRVNLNWDQQAGARQGLFRKSGGIDLDLGCLFELTDGTKGTVQALGNSFGNVDGPPYVQLDKDDRSGQATDGENLFINGAYADRVRRALVYAFIYEGVANWSEANAVVTIHPPGGAPITIRLDEHQNGKGMCGICLIEGGPSFSVERHVVYVGGHKDLDNQFGWGLNWTRGRK